MTDGIDQVQRLLVYGADPKKITLDGLSLGGAVATMVAYHFYQNDKDVSVSLSNDRSLATLDAAAAGMLAPNLPGPLGDALFASSASTSWSVMKPTGWVVDVAKAYKAIPAENKFYMVVAKAKDYPGKPSLGDGVIAHRASLHKGVKDDEKKKGICTGHKVLAYGMFGHNQSRRALISKDNPHISGQDLYEQFVMRNR